MEIESDSPTYATLDQLLAATDLVVRARVTSTERGRVFGEPGEETALESRLVALEVTEVLRGAEPPAEFLVEEEGWLLDGSPLIVDGLVPSAEGDDAIWFLVDPSTDTQEPTPFVTVNAQGRYLVVDGALIGADGTDPLVGRLPPSAPTASNKPSARRPEAGYVLGARPWRSLRTVPTALSTLGPRSKVVSERGAA